MDARLCSGVVPVPGSEQPFGHAVNRASSSCLVPARGGKRLRRRPAGLRLLREPGEDVDYAAVAAVR